MDALYPSVTARTPRSWLGSYLLIPVCVALAMSEEALAVLGAGSVFLGTSGGMLAGAVSAGLAPVGGLLGQVLAPAVLAAFFARLRFCFGMQAGLLWLAHNLVYLGRFGPESADWPALLAVLGLDPFDYLLGSACMLVGVIAFVAALALPAVMEE